MNPEITCCFTGHRPTRLPWGKDEQHPDCRKLKLRMAEAIEEAYHKGYRHFICGMAQGADLYFGEAVITLKETYPDITLEAAIPYDGQADRWATADRLRYVALLRQCSLETVVQHDYTPWCMQRRNRYMVDHARMLIAVYDGLPKGGTLNTLSYAISKGLEILVLEP